VQLVIAALQYMDHDHVQHPAWMPTASDMAPYKPAVCADAAATAMAMMWGPAETAAVAAPLQQKMALQPKHAASLLLDVQTVTETCDLPVGSTFMPSAICGTDTDGF
jgi:hypothetical protein